MIALFDAGGGTLSTDDWTYLLKEQLGADFATVLERLRGQLRFRGIRPAKASMINEIIDRVFANSNDILETLSTKPQYLTEAHLSDVMESLLRSAVDQFQEASVAADSNLTTKRRWVVNYGSTIDSKEAGVSRHAALDQTVIDTAKGETFTVGEYNWTSPRQDQRAVSQASNCRCGLQFKTRDGRWV